jgi:hypothetical protein
VADLEQWIEDDFSDLLRRLQGGVRGQVPADRRAEGAGGTSILWNTLHIARHSALALSALTGSPWPTPDWLADAACGEAGGGLQESARPWAGTLSTPAVDAYADDVLARVAVELTATRLRTLDLDTVPDTAGALRAAGLGEDEFGWLYGMWVGKPVGWLIRWPLLGHSGSHVGEMLATRGRLGLSPF